MAANGRTNREMGQKSYLAHRTVAYHLYRILPSSGSRCEATQRLSFVVTNQIRWQSAF
jgi:hypothetical protein